MNQNQILLEELYAAVSKFRGVYAAWARQQGIPYHELLVLYRLWEKGSCSQKEICDLYLLPKQTVHNIISRYRSQNYLEIDDSLSNGREKVFRFTKSGAAYAKKIMKPLSEKEEEVILRMGTAAVRSMADLTDQFGELLQSRLDVGGNS